jgi:hypothetical protein
LPAAHRSPARLRRRTCTGHMPGSERTVCGRNSDFLRGECGHDEEHDDCRSHAAASPIYSVACAYVNGVLLGSCTVSLQFEAACVELFGDADAGCGANRPGRTMPVRLGRLWRRGCRRKPADGSRARSARNRHTARDIDYHADTLCNHVNGHTIVRRRANSTYAHGAVVCQWPACSA